LPVYLGIDTGGTFTDAVVFDPERGILASSKSLTTRHDLSIGVAGAVAALGDSLAAVARVDMVSLSTTLATNAIVEGQGSPVCLVLIGQDVDVLSRFGLREALGQDPVAHVSGGHTHEGVQREPLDEAVVRSVARTYKGHVAAFAVVGHFGVLNPEHELRAAAILREETGHPVTCSHELTARLNAPRRAITCILNGRLIPLIDQLICAVQQMLANRGIRAPLMVVQADGSIVNAESARLRPVLTILSGPAASVIGAGYLAGCSDGLVADIGGTTTDLALLKNGQPKLNVDGAVVGAWRTMVEAVDVATVGLGGDSDIDRDEQGQLLIGPQRAVPLSLLAAQFPEVIDVLRGQLKSDQLENTFGRFALRLRALDTDVRHLGKFEQLAWNAVDDCPVSLASLFQDRSRRLPFEVLRRRGLVGVAAFTPSDAAHVLGRYTHWNREAAELGALLWLRRLNRDTTDATGAMRRFAEEVVERVTVRAGEVIARYLFESDHPGEPIRDSSHDLRLVREALRPEPNGDLHLRLSMALPIIAVGGPAATYFPAVGERLGTRTVVPEHAAVCNALGAVVGGVVQRVEARITSPLPGLFRVHLPDGAEDFSDLESAAEFAAEEASIIATERARAAGAGDVRVVTARSDRIGTGPNGTSIFVESSVRARAAGQPLTQR
jgi:N-methylhydantoinase A/oxoprolinase/acetone carboxylase beta subunit